MRQLPVVAQVDIALQTMLNRVVIEVQIAIVHYQRIERITRFKRTHFAEERTTRLSRQIEGFAQR